MALAQSNTTRSHDGKQTSTRRDEETEDEEEEDDEMEPNGMEVGEMRGTQWGVRGCEAGCGGGIGRQMLRSKRVRERRCQMRLTFLPSVACGSQKTAAVSVSSRANTAEVESTLPARFFGERRGKERGTAVGMGKGGRGSTGEKVKGV